MSTRPGWRRPLWLDSFDGPLVHGIVTCVAAGFVVSLWINVLFARWVMAPAAVAGPILAAPEPAPVVQPQRRTPLPPPAPVVAPREKPAPATVTPPPPPPTKSTLPIDLVATMEGGDASWASLYDREAARMMVVETGDLVRPGVAVKDIAQGRVYLGDTNRAHARSFLQMRKPPKTRPRPKPKRSRKKKRKKKSRKKKRRR